MTRAQSLSATQKSTSTHHQSMKGTSQGYTTMETSPKSTKMNSPTLIASSAAFLANLLASQECDEGLKTQEVRSFLTSHGYLGKSNHAIVSLRTSKGYYLTMKGAHSLPSSPRLMSWGMTVNGKCLTARISVSPKTGNASTLSDILEEHPGQKYFLSEEQTKRIMSSGISERAAPSSHTDKHARVTNVEKVITGQPTYEDGVRVVKYSVSEESPTLRATHYKNGDNQPRVLMPEDTTTRIRRLTPKECERLQAFPDDWTKYGMTAGGTEPELDSYEVSDTQRYKMCGNAVTTNVVRALFERLVA